MFNKVELGVRGGRDGITGAAFDSHLYPESPPTNQHPVQEGTCPLNKKMGVLVPE